MKPTLILILSAFLLASCAPVGGIPTSTPVLLAPTLTPEPTSTPTPMPTATPVLCDPFLVDFCITQGHFIFQRPILPPANDAVAAMYRFGSTANGTREPHHGVEFVNGLGTPVHAAADGEVIFSGADEKAVFSPWSDFYGNLIVIRHADDLFTLYAHLSFLDVWAGQAVKAGQKIGEVGKSGAAIGSHLHFEVRKGGDGRDYFSTQNPELWLYSRQDRGVLAISILDGNSEFQPAELNLQYQPDSAAAPPKVYFISTYAGEITSVSENALMGELLAGHYRIALTVAGHVYERWVDVESGQLTQVVIVVR